jgi:hypothetical protein
MADQTYDEKKDAMRRAAQKEESDRVEKYARPLDQIHPDSLPMVSPSLLKQQYAPTLAEFEAKYGSLPADSKTRRTYAAMEADAKAAPTAPAAAKKP